MNCSNIAGGIVGRTSTSDMFQTIILNSHSSGTIKSRKAGGILGRNRQTLHLKNCYMTGNVLSKELKQPIVAELTEYEDNIIDSNYWIQNDEEYKDITVGTSTTISESEVTALIGI